MPESTAKADYFVGVDLGGTKILAGVFDEKLSCLGRNKMSTKSDRGPEEVIDRIARCARDVIDECDLDFKQVRAVGVGAPGAVDPETGRRRPVKGLPVIAAEACAKGGDAIESLLGRFVRENDEIASIQSTLDTQTRWLLSEPIRDDLQKNGIDFSNLKKKPTTVYVILPPERMRTHSVWLRLVIVSALRALYSEGGLRTVMMIDEMAALGHLGPLEDAFGLVRGYNIQIAAILQDLPQLKAIYKERWETFIANAGIVFGFAPNDLTTADWMSKRSGQTTVVVKSVSENRSQSVGPNTNTNIGSGTGDQQMARPLYLPHEFMGLWEGFGVMWIAGSDGTTRTYSPFYLDIKRCRERAAKRPNSVNL